ncbi:hypothetical protein pdam_00023842 [Pocillopora damicornis]|uniref:Uncharacterized protein n=1 Tax=Pocillopora damicornis TaxID=46731 RepID=A0A3M6TW77_POCDA|nr:hypothetical protein pdam_00023842 [Pocillopora damicornis]
MRSIRKKSGGQKRSKTKVKLWTKSQKCQWKK